MCYFIGTGFQERIVKSKIGRYTERLRQTRSSDCSVPGPNIRGTLARRSAWPQLMLDRMRWMSYFESEELPLSLNGLSGPL